MNFLLAAISGAYRFSLACPGPLECELEMLGFTYSITSLLKTIKFNDLGRTVF